MNVKYIYDDYRDHHGWLFESKLMIEMVSRVVKSKISIHHKLICFLQSFVKIIIHIHIKININIICISYYLASCLEYEENSPV